MYIRKNILLINSNYNGNYSNNKENILNKNHFNCTIPLNFEMYINRIMLKNVCYI